MRSWDLVLAPTTLISIEEVLVARMQLELQTYIKEHVDVLVEIGLKKIGRRLLKVLFEIHLKHIHNCRDYSININVNSLLQAL